MIALLGAGMVGGLVLAAAAPLPAFNVEPSCRAAAARAGDPAYLAVCMRKEQDARDAIDRQWPQFTGADRARCLPGTTNGRRQTYTELLTCLEMARDVRNLRREADPVTTGQVRR
jgi:hypothetical protein